MADGHSVRTDLWHYIVVIADEAHRSLYDFIDGFSRHMREALPNASFIGFTGTTIEKTDANTRAVRQIIPRAVAPERVIDISAEAGLAKPEVRGMP